MARKGRARLRALAQRVAHDHPELDATAAITGGLVRVGGLVITNPHSIVRDTVPVIVGVTERELRGEQKLAAALRIFGVSVTGRIALDLGAAAGGFTRTLLRAGAIRVYAVDAGFGELIGALRQDPSVVNLERTNLGDLSHRLVPDEIEIVTVDLSYLALSSALPQLDGRVSIGRNADLVALIKPMFELHLAKAPTDTRSCRAACRKAWQGAERAGWEVLGIVGSPVAGRKGAAEFLLHARRAHPV